MGRAAARQAGACPLEQQERWEEAHPGARASRPHALPYRAAQFPCDGAPGHAAGENAMGRAAARQADTCPSSSNSDGRRPTRERGRLARILCRIVPLRFPAMGTRPPCRRERYRQGCSPASRRVPLEQQERWEDAHPGARASRPHALPLRTTQFPCDETPDHPAGGNGIGRAAALRADACPSSSKSDGRMPIRERGRPARMHCRIVPLSFPAMGHPATLPAGTAWARPKQSPGTVASRSRWRRSPRVCQDVCGRDARAPGWASFRDVVAAKEVHRCLC